MANTQTKIKVKFGNTFEELFNPSWRYLIYYGGRSSGKSYHVALSLLLRGRTYKLRVLATREIQNTIKDSVHKLLSDLIEKYGFSEYRVTADSIINTKTGTEFIFKGLRMNVTEIKSLEGVDICWVEEAQSVSDKSLDVLTPTIRKEGSQIIFTFNRLHELDPVYVRYVLHKAPTTYVKKANYDVLEKAGLLTEATRLEIEADKNDPELYAHKWLGEPMGQTEKAILNRNQVLEAMKREIPDDGVMIVGVDVARMGGDRTVFWKRKGLKTIDTAIHTKLRTTEVVAELIKFVGFDKTVELRVDDTGVGGGVTDELIKQEYTVVPVNFGGVPSDKNKYPNWISEAWFALHRLMPDIQLPYDSDLLMELSTRQWAQDAKGKRAVESKKQYKDQGFRSPDLADACVICYYTPDTVFDVDTDIAIV